MKWITDLEKTVLLSNFEKRGWVRGSSEGRVYTVISRDLASQLRLKMPLVQVASTPCVSCRRRNGCTSNGGFRGGKGGANAPPFGG